MPENLEEIIFLDSHCRREDALKMGELDKEVRLNLKNKPSLIDLSLGLALPNGLVTWGPIYKISYDNLTIILR